MHGHNQKFAFTIDGGLHHSSEPDVDGRQLREAAGLTPPEDFVLIILAHRSAQSVGLDRQIRLRRGETAAFRSFRADRSFTFTVDGRGYEWGEDRISEADVRALAEVPDDDEIVLDRGEVVGRDQTISLAGQGVERLRTRKRPPALITIIVNTRRHQVPPGEIAFERLVALAFETPPTGPNVSFTVLYRKGPNRRPEGSVVAGQSVHIREGEVFNVRFTDKS